MRIALAKVLLSRPDILLLDEPTNYLDLEARNWLEKFLKDFKGGVLIVSHDRYFLDITVNEVIELFNSKLKRYKGNYSSYEKTRRTELETLTDQYKRQQEEIAKHEDFINRFRSNASKATLVQSRIKYLEKLTLIEIPENLKKFTLNFLILLTAGNRFFRFRIYPKLMENKEFLIISPLILPGVRKLLFQA